MLTQSEHWDKRCCGVPLVDQVDPTAQSSDPIAGVFSRLGELRAFEKTSACEIGPSAKTDKGINAYLVPRSEFLLSDPCERRNFRISDVERYWENYLVDETHGEKSGHGCLLRTEASAPRLGGSGGDRRFRFGAD